MFANLHFLFFYIMDKIHILQINNTQYFHDIYVAEHAGIFSKKAQH